MRNIRYYALEIGILVCVLMVTFVLLVVLEHRG